jgi:hypothetical protein
MKKPINLVDYSTQADFSSVERAEKREGTRSTIAQYFIFAYIGIVVALLVLTTFFNLASETVKDFLLAVGSPLGFIIGYYFKSTDSE